MPWIVTDVCMPCYVWEECLACNTACRTHLGLSWWWWYWACPQVPNFQCYHSSHFLVPLSLIDIVLIVICFSISCMFAPGYPSVGWAESSLLSQQPMALNSAGGPMARVRQDDGQGPGTLVSPEAPVEQWQWNTMGGRVVQGQFRFRMSTFRVESWFSHFYQVWLSKNLFNFFYFLP